MKKISILIVLSMICLMLLGACGKAAAPEGDDSAPAASENVEKKDKNDKTGKNDKNDADAEDAEKTPESTEGTKLADVKLPLDTTYTVEKGGDDDKNANGDVIGKCHFQKLVFTNPNAALKKINEKIAAEQDKFFSEGLGAQYEEYFSQLDDNAKAGLVEQPYFAIYDVGNVYTDDKYVSIQYIWDWFAGGVRNFGGLGYNFDIETGNEIHFVDLFASEADAAEAFSGALNELITENSDVFFEDASNTVANYDMSSVKFSLQDGMIVVYIDQYELAPGALGSFTVPIER